MAAKQTRVERTQNKNKTKNCNKDKGEMVMNATGRKVTTKKTEQQHSK